MNKTNSNIKNRCSLDSEFLGILTTELDTSKLNLQISDILGLQGIKMSMVTGNGCKGSLVRFKVTYVDPKSLWLKSDPYNKFINVMKSHGVTNIVLLDEIQIENLNKLGVPG